MNIFTLTIKKENSLHKMGKGFFQLSLGIKPNVW